jgi:hypothetical protein
MHRDFITPDTPHARKLHAVDLVLTRGLYLFTAIVLIINTVVIISRQDRNHDTFNRVVDCTTPGHGCYEREQQRAVEFIQQLDDVVIISNYCASRPVNDTLGKVRTCVKENS